MWYSVLFMSKNSFQLIFYCILHSTINKRIELYAIVAATRVEIRFTTLS